MRPIEWEVGDKFRLRADLVQYEYYGKSEENWFHPCMGVPGDIFTIKKIEEHEHHGLICWIEENGYYYTFDMIEKLDALRIQPKHLAVAKVLRII